MKAAITLLALLVVSSGYFINESFAEIDLSDQRIISLDGNVIIEFAENTRDIAKRGVTVTPNLDFGLLNLADGTVFLDSQRTNILANSFSILLDNGKIYAKNNRDGTFDIKVLTAKNGKFQKEIFSAIIEPIETSFKEVVTTEPIQAEEKIVTDLLMLGKYSQVTAIKNEITFDIRIFDESLNPLKEYKANYGYLEGADVTIAIKDSQNKILWFIEDKTNKFGYSLTVFRVENNYLLVGEYEAAITIQYEENTYEKTVPVFINQPTSHDIFTDFLRIN